MVIGPAVMLLQPGTGVEVLVGVYVMVGVNVTVGVNVSVGVRVGVQVSKGVKVSTSPPGSVAVGVWERSVGFSVGVSDGISVGGSAAPGVFVGVVVGTTLFPVVISRIPNMVRALDEETGRELSGISESMGLEVEVTVTTMRSGSSKVFTLIVGSSEVPTGQTSKGEPLPGP